MRVFWFPYKQQYDDGTWEIRENIGLNDGPRGRLFLEEIKAMPPGKPITLVEAQNIADQERKRVRQSDLRASFQFHDNFIPFLVSQGYQIILTGREFEIREEAEVPYKSPLQQEWEQHPEPAPIVWLTIRLEGYIFKLLTLKQRPPIQGMRRVDEHQIEILYETGARELAKKTNPETESYMISHLIAELWKGEAPTVEPFRWAA